MQSDFKKVLGWVFFVAFLFALSYSARCALSPLLVAFENDIGVGHTEATSLLFMQGIGLSISLGLCGFLLSKVRPRHMASFSIFATGLCFISIPLWESLNQFRVVFLFVGLTAGLYFPAAMKTLASLVKYEDWGKAVGIHELAPNISFILFPIFAQFVLDMSEWRMVFVLWGTLMIASGLSFFFFGKGGVEYAAPTSIKSGLKLLKHPTTWIFIYLLFIGLVGEFTIFSILQLYLVHSLDVDATNANHLLAFSRILTPFTVIIGGIIADRYNPRTLLVLFFGLHTLSLLMMGLGNFYVAILGIALQAISIALSFPAIFKLLAFCYEVSIQPIVISMTMPLAGFFGTAIAPSFLGYMGQEYSFELGFLITAVFSLAIVFMLFLVKPYEQKI